MKIRSKFLLIYLSVSFAILTVLIISIYFTVKNSVVMDLKKQLNAQVDQITMQTEMAVETSIKNYLRAIAEKNLDLVSYYYSQYRQGKLTEDEAKSRAKDVLLAQKVGSTGYLYCLNSQGVVQVHPKKELINTNVSNFSFVKTQLQTKKGYVEYMWKNPGEIIERQKALYMDYFPDWDWIVSASSYKEEFQALVDLKDIREKTLSIKIGKTGYCTIMDTTCKLLIHPTLEGQSVLDKTDYKGKYIFRELLRNKSGNLIYDWRERNGSVREKFTYYRRIEKMGWIVMIISYTDEFYGVLNSLQFIMAIAIILTVIIFSLVSFGMGTLLVRPIKAMISAMKDIAQGNGDLTQRMHIESKDELGELAQWVNSFIEKLQKLIRDISVNTEKLNGAADELSTASNQISSSAEEINSQTSSVSVSDKQITANIASISKTAEEVSTSVASVAASIEEMSSSLNKVNLSCKNESEMTASASTEAKTAQKIVSNLGNSAKEIGKVIEIISDIADQTNLLALNATIEAASAGDAGRGFAVVADEVKELARQTVQSAEQIRIQVEGIQNTTGKAVDAIEKITTIIQEINTNSQSIVQSVEEQSSMITEVVKNVNESRGAVADIAKKVADSAGGIAEVSTAIESVNIGTEETAVGVGKVHTQLEQLVGMTAALKNIVNSFKI